jgi:hypothetical protein
MRRLVLPHTMNARACLDFTIEAPTLYASPEPVVVDLSELQWSFPLGLLVVGSTIRRIRDIRRQLGLVTRFEGIDLSANQCQSYIAHLGFFDFIGLEHGARIGEASGSMSYIPIRSIRVAEITPGISNWDEMTARIDAEAMDLATVLVGRCNNSEFRAVSYILREALRNAMEHSGAEECYFCAQRWKDGRVQIAILDEGSGIKFSLSQSYGGLETDALALEAAILPGVSRVSAKPALNIHGNSGYGLYVMSEIGRSFGFFALASGDSCLHLNAKGREHRLSSHSGTFLGLHLAKAPLNFVALLDDLIAAGEAEADANGAIRNASRASRSVTIAE